jgi:SSS family solute:Na+ symporter
MPELDVTATDLAVVLIYLVATRIAFGWYFARRLGGAGAEGYFLAGRRIGWPLIGLSFYVSNMSGGSFIGLPGSGYHSGIAVYHYEWMPALVLVLFVFVFLPLFLEARVVTSAQFLARRYGARVHLVFSAFMLTTSVVVDATASLYAGGKIVQTLFPDFPAWIAVAAAALGAGVYIAFGGLGAVVYNDALQATLIFLGGLITLVLAWRHIPSWEAVERAAAPEALHLIRPLGDEMLPWPGLVTGVLVLSLYFWCMNQFMIQRALGARSLTDGRRGALFAGLLKLPNLFILILPGVMATAIYPDLPEPDLVFPTLVFDLLPIGLRGLMLAVIAAAVLSSLEAILNSAATLFTMDFVRAARPRTSDAALERWGRIASIGFMALAVAWAPVVTNFPTLWQYLQSILSYLVPPVVAMFLLGVFWPRANGWGALAAMAIAVPAGALGWGLVEVADLVAIHFLYVAGLQFALGGALVVAGSLLTAPPPPERLEGSVFRIALLRRDREPATRWYGDDRIQAAALATLALGLVVWWW